MNTTDKLSYGLLTAALLLLLGTFIAHLLSKSRGREEKRKQAAKIFINQFIDELDLLRSRIDYGDTYDILEPAAQKHKRAVVVFRQYLGARERSALDKAWQEYYEHPQQSGIPFLEQYFNGGSLDKRKINRKVAIERIEKLLGFAMFQ